ncbi:superinfection immunity protein [Methylobacterium sp. E-045]|uniref:superinfection immunity protein n=1 Tax=Methylobacterium sp. E-045 TaxID=2836575 RepID=UPI001FB91C09|nr:superinfection immunity protein [Methylobacterium sp. E-045]MCJ2128691.1 superinfection immunity protein [Methylobacterium sp. E-045]
MNDDTAWVLVAVTVCVAVYGLPSIIAFHRRHPNRWIILAVNGLFGGTLVGWVVTLAWALHAVHRPEQPGASQGGESGLNLFVNDTRRVALVAGPHGDNGGHGRPAPSPADAVRALERVGDLRTAGPIPEPKHRASKSALTRRL